MIFAANENPQPTKKIRAVAQAPRTVLNGGGINTPFSNAEENFYQKAWPIEKSHSSAALILYGSVLTTLLFFVIRKMAKSKPRKQKEP
jgi:hypothetical protein